MSPSFRPILGPYCMVQMDPRDLNFDSANFVLDGWNYNIAEIGMSNQSPISKGILKKWPSKIKLV